MKTKRSLAVAGFLSCLLWLCAGTASADFVGLSFTGTDLATGLPVTGAFQYDPAQFALNVSGAYVTSNAGAATIGLIVNGTTKYTTSSDQNVPIEAVVGGLTTHQFESFPRVVAVGGKTGSFEQYISARG